MMIAASHVLRDVKNVFKARIIPAVYIRIYMETGG